MPVTASNGTAISATEVQWPCKKYTGMYLFCNYTKGTETGVTLEFTATDDTEPVSGADDAYYIVEVAASTGVISKWSVTLNATIKAIIPVPLPECTDFVNMIVTFNTPGLTPGALVVFANMDNIYR